MDCVPVAELVGDVEVQRPPRRGVRHRRAELAERRTGPRGVDDPPQRAIGRLIKDRLRDRAMLIPARIALATDGERFIERLPGFVKQPRQRDGGVATRRFLPSAPRP